MKIGVWIKAGPQPLFPAEPGVKNGWADPNYISCDAVLHMNLILWIRFGSCEVRRLNRAWESVRNTECCLPSYVLFCWTTRLQLREQSESTFCTMGFSSMLYWYPGTRGVVSYISYITMCGPKGYGFSAVLVINRVTILAFKKKPFCFHHYRKKN